jgi:iron complex outermembrane receptor protein
MKPRCLLRSALALAPVLWIGPTLAQTAGAAAPAAAASAPAPAPQRVEITGGRTSDDQERRQSTAAKIVIGREEIEKFGDASVGEVLRRLPGITTPGPPGRGGPPRLRGLGGGYTQLLLDGQRIPPGFSLESLTPDQIERIEILRAPTAETGARAIAGTINIITRGGYRRRLNDLRTGAGTENGEWGGGAFWTHNDSSGPLTYNLHGSLFRRRSATGSLTETITESSSAGRIERSEAQDSLESRTGLNLGARLQWQLGAGGDSLMLHPTLFTTVADSRRDFALVQQGGAATYDRAEAGGDSRFTNLRLNSQWRQRLGERLHLELQGGLGAWRSRNDSLREEFNAASSVRTLDDRSASRERSANLTAKFSGGAGGGAARTDPHQLVGGIELEAITRREERTTLENGQPLATDFGENLRASSRRIALYGQDEWAINPNWSLHAGARWESITTEGDAGDDSRPRNRSSVFTPLVHLLWKPDAAKRDQVRLSLTRSYRSPNLANLIARPALSTNVGKDEPNDPTRPDRIGNPDLKPELATGLDLAFERYLEGGGLLSANLFHRRIGDLMRSVTTLETVSWSKVPRWVARQQNIGDALTQGIELEAKFRLDQVIVDAPRIEWRSNLSLYRSRVDGVPGPNDRLAEQAKASANLGADYRFRGLPLTVGGNLNWVPGYRTRLTETQIVSVNTKRQFDAFGLWTINPTVGLRLLASNLGPRDHVTGNQQVFSDLSESSSTAAPTYTQWQLRLELKL